MEYDEKKRQMVIDKQLNNLDKLNIRYKLKWL